MAACFVALGEGDGRLLLALGLGDGRPPGPLGGHLAGHRLEHAGRRVDLADLDVGHLHTPALGDLVEPDPQRGVHVLALGQHVVEGHVADDAAQRRGGDVQRGAGEVLHREHRHRPGRRPCRR